MQKNASERPLLQERKVATFPPDPRGFLSELSPRKMCLRDFCALKRDERELKTEGVELYT